MKCQVCNKNVASVHVTEIPREHHEAARRGQRASAPAEKHICELCAQELKVPQMHVPLIAQKQVVDIWKLLHQSAKKARDAGGLACPECGMTLAEFRSKGRLGCPKDYEVFREHLMPLLERIHNAREHRGRLPHTSESDRERRQHLTDLRAKLEAAIKDEAYESAAELRDQIQELETHPTRVDEGS
jgi:protein arginine kinase activator